MFSSPKTLPSPKNPRPGKAQKRLQSLAAGQEGVPLLSAVACDEDAMSKEDIVAEDGASVNHSEWSNGDLTHKEIGMLKI